MVLTEDCDLFHNLYITRRGGVLPPPVMLRRNFNRKIATVPRHPTQHLAMTMWDGGMMWAANSKNCHCEPRRRRGVAIWKSDIPAFSRAWLWQIRSPRAAMASLAM